MSLDLKKSHQTFSKSTLWFRHLEKKNSLQLEGVWTAYRVPCEGHLEGELGRVLGPSFHTVHHFLFSVQMGTLRTSTKVGWWVCGRAEAGIQRSDLWPNFWPISPPSYPHTWLDFPLLRTTGFIHQINTLYLWVRSPGCDTFTIKLAGKILGHLSFLQESSKPIFLPGTAASAPGWGESTPSGPGGRSCCGYRDLGDSQGLGLSWRARWCLLERDLFTGSFGGCCH